MKLKGKKEEKQGVGGQNSNPPHLNSVNPKKKKKKLYFFIKFSNIPNLKFSTQNFFFPKFSNSYSQCPNFEFNSSVFNKNSNFKFHDQDSKPWF